MKVVQTIAAGVARASDSPALALGQPTDGSKAVLVARVAARVEVNEHHDVAPMEEKSFTNISALVPPELAQWRALATERAQARVGHQSTLAEMRTRFHDEQESECARFEAECARLCERASPHHHPIA